MIALNPSYVVDTKQRRKSVLLPVVEWNRIIRELEELDDIRAYDAAKHISGETISFEQAVAETKAGDRRALCDCDFVNHSDAIHED